MMKSFFFLSGALCLALAGCAASTVITTEKGPAGKPMGLVAFQGSGGGGKLWGIRDAAGKVLIAPRYHSVDAFISEEAGGLVVHRWVEDSSWPLKDYKGQEKECFGQCERMDGVVDEQGREVVAPEYNRVMRMGPYRVAARHYKRHRGPECMAVFERATGAEVLPCRYPFKDFSFNPMEDFKTGNRVSRLRLGPGEADFAVVEELGAIKAKNLRNAIYSSLEKDWIIQRQNGSVELLNGGPIPELAEVAEFVGVLFDRDLIPYRAKSGKWGFLKVRAEHKHTQDWDLGVRPYDQGNHRIAGPAVYDKVTWTERGRGRSRAPPLDRALTAG